MRIRLTYPGKVYSIATLLVASQMLFAPLGDSPEVRTLRVGVEALDFKDALDAARPGDLIVIQFRLWDNGKLVTSSIPDRRIFCLTDPRGIVLYKAVPFAISILPSREGPTMLIVDEIYRVLTREAYWEHLRNRVKQRFIGQYFVIPKEEEGAACRRSLDPSTGESARTEDSNHR